MSRFRSGSLTASIRTTGIFCTASARSDGRKARTSLTGRPSGWWSPWISTRTSRPTSNFTICPFVKSAVNTSGSRRSSWRKASPASTIFRVRHIPEYDGDCTYNTYGNKLTLTSGCTPAVTGFIGGGWAIRGRGLRMGHPVTMITAFLRTAWRVSWLHDGKTYVIHDTRPQKQRLSKRKPNALKTVQNSCSTNGIKRRWSTPWAPTRGCARMP